MSWDKTDLQLADALEGLVSGYIYKKKPMFGCPVYFVNDNMWTGVKGGVVFIRLSEDDRNAIQKDCDEVTPFEPRPNFFMREYVAVPDDKLSDHLFIKKWLDSSYSYTAALPPKVRKEKKKR